MAGIACGCALIFLIAANTATDSSTADKSKPTTDSFQGEGASVGGGTRRISPHVEERWLRRVDSGVLFVDGRYVPPPYVVQVDGSSATINGHPTRVDVVEPVGFAMYLPDDGSGRSRDRGRRSPFGRPPGMEHRQGIRAAQVIIQSFEANAVLVAFTGRKLAVLDYPGAAAEFYRAATDNSRRETALHRLLDILPTDADHGQWRDWLANFTAPDDVLQAGLEAIDLVDATNVRNERSVAAVRRLDRLAYPLTTLGLLGAVVSLGYLLSNAPRQLKQPATDDDRRDVERAIVVLLLLIGLLSGLDLTWTILKTQAGQMRELNPFGEQLLTNPALLAVFKSVATLSSCAILYALRGHGRARVACWWLCLICTVVTFRWLIFNSMFVA